MGMRMRMEIEMKMDEGEEESFSRGLSDEGTNVAPTPVERTERIIWA